MNNLEKFEALCAEIDGIRGCTVFGDYEDINDSNCSPYVEVGIVTNDRINRAKDIITKHGFTITEEHDVCGSDYDSYCIWFKE